MSALLLSALAAGSSGQGALYVDDVFSTYLYTGNGSTQTINNGIDLAGKGGLVWVKRRDTGGQLHTLVDTARGAGWDLNSSNTAAQSFDSTSLTSFGSSGFSVGSSPGHNGAGGSLVSWTFRRSPKFFDVVTYTGDGVAGRQIAHSLGVQAGFVTVKATSTTGDWNSYHRSATGDLKLNLTDAQTASRAIITAADTNSFTVSGAANTNGVSYVAYLFAHDPSADGVIQAGSYIGTGSSGLAVNLGWEPQYVMIKPAIGVTGNWHIVDSMRGMDINGNNSELSANSSDAESFPTGIKPTATGFELVSTNVGWNGSGNTYIYLAIRRPNKPPTTGTQVYNSSIASGVVSAGFPVDLHIGATRTGAANNHAVHSRLVGGTKELVTSSTVAEAAITDLGFDSMTGLRASLPAGGVNHFFRRAPGFFDVVCYTGTGVARTVPHNLGVAPELVIVKRRSGAELSWRTLHVATVSALNLDSASAAPTFAAANKFGNTSVVINPTFTQFTVGDDINIAGITYIAYLFATLPEVSKIGSYTGNGSSQTIDCGFSTGARFVLIKRTDATGDWYVWDSVRGIIAANDPHLSLNTTAAEVTTDDSIDPASVGFIVNQNAATNINVNGGSYIFLAIA